MSDIKHIINLHGVTYDECTKTYCLVHPYVNHTDIRDLPDPDITLSRVQKYVGQILKVSLLVTYFRRCSLLIRLASCTETSNPKTCCMIRRPKRYLLLTGAWLIFIYPRESTMSEWHRGITKGPSFYSTTNYTDIRSISGR